MNHQGMMQRASRLGLRALSPHRRRAGLTLLELLISASIGTMLSLGLASLMIMASRMQKSIMTQQISLAQAMKSIEGLNREIRMAAAPLLITDAGGAGAIQGNRVVFGRMGEASNLRSVELVSGDADMMSPGDNRLVYDPDTTRAGDELTLARNITPINAGGAFRYEGATKPLQVQMRIGDPVGGATAGSNAYTGVQMQGVEINISIAPRNDSTI